MGGGGRWWAPSSPEAGSHAAVAVGVDVEATALSATPLRGSAALWHGRLLLLLLLLLR